MGSQTEPLQIPKIDLTGLQPNTPAWDVARGEVMQALETYRCFEALYDEVTPELRDALFARAAPELFGLPLETKLRNTSEMPYQAYMGQFPGLPYESLRVDHADGEGAEEFTRLMWPQGNPRFRDTVYTYAKHLKDMEQMIERMVFQSMGVEEYCKIHIKSISYGVRLAEYGAPLDQETKIAMVAHLDPNLLTIICQHQVDGLEVQTGKGKWMRTVPSPNSFTVIVGQTFEAWSNGKLQPSLHRVRMFGTEKRYSVLFNSLPENGYMIQVPKELVDEEHPLLYKPFEYNDYIRFIYSEDGAGVKDTIKAFCCTGEKNSTHDILNKD